MSNKRPLRIPPATSTEDIELASISNNPTLNNPTDTIETLLEPTSVVTRAGPPRNRFGRISEGGQHFSIYLMILLGIGRIVRFFKIREVDQVNARSKDLTIPLFTFISIMGCAGSAVLYGRPYSPPCVLVACLCPAAFIAWRVPGLIDWWDKMSALFSMLAYVIEYFVYWKNA